MEECVNMVGMDGWLVPGWIVGVVFPAVRSVSWNEQLHACMDGRIVEVLNEFLSVADAE